MTVLTRRGGVALVVSVTLLAGLTACVAPPKSPTAQVTGTISKSALKCGAGTGKAATGTPIEVRAVATASGGVDFSSAPIAATAYFKCLNANGGINGHPVDYKWQDDALNPTKSAQIAAQFGADSTVVADVGDATFIGCDVANDQFKKYGLYSITGVGVPESCFNSSNIAPINAGPRNSAIGVVQYLKSAGKAGRVFSIGLNTQGNGTWTEAGVEAYAKSAGVNIVGTALTNPTDSNFLPLLNKIKAANPTAVVIADPAPITASILAAAQKQGMKGDITWGCTASCYDAQFGQQIGSYWDGFVANSELALVDSKGPDNETWKSVLSAYAPSSAPRDTFSQAGFLAAKTFSEALIAAKLSTYDRASVSKVLLAIKGVKSDLLCSPWYFGEAAAHNANHDTRTAVVKNGVYQELTGCTPSGDPALSAIKANETAQGLAG